MGTEDRPIKTITRLIRRPSLVLGNEIFAADQIKEARISVRIEGSTESRSASIILTPSPESRWDYHAEVKLYEEKGVILTGICTEARYNDEGNLDLTLAGPFWRLERTWIGSFETFGMTKRESLYWMLRLTEPDRPPVFPSLVLDTSSRPFMYAIPIRGLAEFNKGLLQIGDTGITSNESDSVFNSILEGAESIKEEEAWNQGCPRVFGVVVAGDYIEAERLALERTNLIIGIINLALGTSMSHFETRYEHQPLTFSAENPLATVSVHPWIVIRETSEPKGWIRKISPAKPEAEERPADYLDRIQFFLSKFLDTAQSGDIHDQLGRRQLSDREGKLLEGVQRALHWLSIASGEEDLRDQFTATWISLESVLNSMKYPGVFDGKRAFIKEEIRERLKDIRIHDELSRRLSVDREMLLNWALSGQWSVRRKLAIFADSFGVILKDGDENLVRDLGRARANVFHEGEENPGVSREKVSQLRHLVERLVVGASIGGYEDLEDGIHEFRIGTIGPEGGGAPISIDGKEDVPWNLRATRNDQGDLVVEWIAEGKIYSEKNMRIV